jgi:micrococcal nuclease
MNSTEKFGRVLGWLYINGDTVSVNDHMINDGYAWAYMGDTKVKDFELLAKVRSKSGK